MLRVVHTEERATTLRATAVAAACEDGRMNPDERLRRGRLAAQRLTAATACSSAEEAARAVIGVQAQDLRAAALALRSRVREQLTRVPFVSRPLLRTWTVRGTAHLIAASDRPWLHALLAERNARMFSARFERFGIVDQVKAMRGDVVELCAERPRDRASLLRALVERGHPSLEQGPINTFVPWLSTQGLIVTDVNGLLHAADPPPVIDHDQALAILGARYRAGYAPATRPTLQSGHRCRSRRRGGRSTPPAYTPTPMRSPPMIRSPVSCSLHSTRSCSGIAPARRSSPPRTTTTSSRAAGCSSQ